MIASYQLQLGVEPVRLIMLVKPRHPSWSSSPLCVLVRIDGGLVKRPAGALALIQLENDTKRHPTRTAVMCVSLLNSDLVCHRVHLPLC